MRLSGRAAEWERGRGVRLSLGVCGRISGWVGDTAECVLGEGGREGGGHTGYVYMVERCTNNNGQITQKLQKRYISIQSNTITMNCKDYDMHGASKSSL